MHDMNMISFVQMSRSHTMTHMQTFKSQLAHFGFHGLFNNIFYLMNFAEYETNIFINGY